LIGAAFCHHWYFFADSVFWDVEVVVAESKKLYHLKAKVSAKLEQLKMLHL